MTRNIYILLVFCLFSLGSLQAQAPGLSLSGQFLTGAGDASGNVDIELRDADGNTISTQHVDCGSTYTIDGLEAGVDYSIHLTKSADAPLNGLSTLDLVLISKHILGLDELPAYSVLAADVNNDDNITVMDMLVLRRLILGIATTFPDGTSWLFTQEANGSASASYDIQLSENVTDYNFIVLKRGDVNNNHVGCE